MFYKWKKMEVFIKNVIRKKNASPIAWAYHPSLKAALSAITDLECLTFTSEVHLRVTTCEAITITTFLLMLAATTTIPLPRMPP